MPAAEAPRDGVLSFALDQSPERVIVYDGARRLVYANLKARKFLDRYALPAEIPSLTGRIFDAIALGRARELFPGEIWLFKEIEERRWLFHVAFREAPGALVCVYFSDETVTGRFDLNLVRKQYRLSRRELDVLRHLLDGLKNLDIAEELGITEQTVKDYLSSIYGKVGVPDRFSLLRHLISASRE
jgi:DNA-binding CsgD family transcriptional regulator